MRLNLTLLFAAFIIISNQLLGISRGPIQPEYASFEEPNATDMVNLSTGDFTYNMPLVNIPGPGGGYTMSLFYHAGIELNEESSWVGLGWNLNPGAITRTVNQHPDDFIGEQQVYTGASPGGHGYSVNWGVYSKYYDSEKGKGGRVGLGSILSVGFGNEAGLTLVGVNANFNSGKVTADPVGIATSLMTVAMYAFPPAGAAVSVGSVATGVGVTIAAEVGGAMLGNAIAGDSWDDNIANQEAIVKTSSDGLFKMRKNYRYRFYGNRTERMYGSLYLGEPINHGHLVRTPGTGTYGPMRRQYSPKVNSAVTGTVYAHEFTNGAVSDVSVYADDEYKWSTRPTSIAYDNYSVSAPGITGSITPYRPDIGSVAFNPSEFVPAPDISTFASTVHTEKVSYSIKNWLHSNSNSSSNYPINFSYKTPFKYRSELSNSYNYHNGIDSRFNFNNQEISITSTVESYPSQSSYCSGSTPPHGLGIKQYIFNLPQERFYKENKYIESNRADISFKNGQLATGKYIQYFTNQELAAVGVGGDPTLNTVYKDHLDPSARNSFRTPLPNHGIGGYVITASDGTSYHFTLPIYQDMQKFYSGTGSTSFLSIEHYNDLATTWLLTGITGADYIDRGGISGNGNGIIDDSDWGYWVKLEYGKFSDNYRFSNPYRNGARYKNINSNLNTDYFISEHEAYYLNTVRTPTHSALFVKQLKDDSKGYFNTYPASWHSAQYTSATKGPSSTLKLKEIIILKNEDFDHLFDDSGLNLDYDNWDNSAYERNGDSHDLILDYEDINTPQWNFIDNNQIRAVRLVYNDSLCKQTPNSFPTNSSLPGSELGSGGKLTLEKVQFYGRGNSKISPDYVFGYQAGNALYNPDYQRYKSDGWGYYSASGTNNIHDHQVTNSADEWSLRNITTPVGSKINIEYERDEYQSISGDNTLYYKLKFDEGASYIFGNTLRAYLETNIDLTTFLSANDIVWINKGKIHQESNSTNSEVWRYFKDYKTIYSVGTNYLEFDVGSPNHGFHWADLSSTGYLRFQVTKKMGGDLRVKKISVIDENGNSASTRYVYTQDGTLTGPSSGVCSQEPELIHKGFESNNLLKQYDYPGPFVMYGKVHVLNNYKAPSDYLSKEVYEFTTPHTNMIYEYPAHIVDNSSSHSQNYMSSVIYDRFPCNSNEYFVRLSSMNSHPKFVNLNVAVNTAKLGALNRITSLSKGYQYKQVTYDYNDIPQIIDFNNTGIGYFTEGTILTERIFSETPAIYYRNIVTKKVYTPLKMESFTIKERGIEKTVENKQWDYITGAVKATEYKNSYGDKYRTEVVPAYEKYQDMGHLLSNPSNKHMLSKETANYLYVENQITPNQWDIISAHVTTWDDQWVYRDYDDTQNKWIWPTSPATGDEVWRPKREYYWKANINSDGTYIDNGVSSVDEFEEFNWTTPSSSNSNWKELISYENYNHQSVLLSQKTPRGVYSSKHLNQTGEHVIVSADNAKFTEVAYTGIEDQQLKGSATYLDGEVFKGVNAIINSNPNLTHTGKKSLWVDNGNIGLVFRVHDLPNNFDVNGNYQMSVWVKNTLLPSSPPTSAYAYFLFDETYPIVAPYLHTHAINFSGNNSEKAGEWYKFTIDIPKNSEVGANLNNANFFEIQVNCGGSTGDAIVLDDFRFYPTDASVVTSVFDYENGLKMAELDNNNISVKWTYDHADRIINIKREMLDSETPSGNGGFKLQKENKYNYGKNLN